MSFAWICHDGVWFEFVRSALLLALLAHQLSSAGLIAVLVPAYCWAYSAFTVQHCNKLVVGMPCGRLAYVQAQAAQPEFASVTAITCYMDCKEDASYVRPAAPST